MSSDKLREPDLLISLQPRQSLWRFRWHGLLLAATLAALLFALLMAVPDRYSATAQVYVNTGSSIARYRESAATESLSFTAADLVAESLLDRERLEGLGIPLGQLQIASTARWGNLFRVSCTDADRRKAIAAVEEFVAVIGGEAAASVVVDDSAGSASGTAQPFRIVEAPYISDVVMPPLRWLWMIASLLLGISAGIGVAVWLNGRSPVFDTADDIAATVDVPVLATISQVRLADAQAERLRELWAFGFSLTIFLLAGAVILVWLHG